TDKVNMEVEAMGSGVLRKIIVPAGSAVPVGALMGVIAKADEDISVFLQPAAPAKAAAPAHESASAPKPAQSAPSIQPPAASAAPAVGGRIFASPLAKRMATDLGFELAEIAGSGPNGRIVRQDIERRAAHAPAA